MGVDDVRLAYGRRLLDGAGIARRKVNARTDSLRVVMLVRADSLAGHRLAEITSLGVYEQNRRI